MRYPNLSSPALFPLDAHLPLDRRRALAQGIALPERAAGTVLLADVSGFTPLMERLAGIVGPQRGAEELTGLLNALFTPLIGQVHGHGGSIVAFGGDALTCWFPERGSARRAAACAVAMQQQVADFGQVDTPAGPAALSMHVGLASGEVRRFCVGRPPHGLRDVLAGTTMGRLTEAQQRAAAGQVVVDAATAACLPAESLGPCAPGFFLLTGPTGSPPLEPLTAEGDVPPLPVRQVRRWLAETLYRRLRARGGFSAELRLVTSMFVHFSGLDYDGDPDAGRKVQRYVSLAQERLAPYEGYLDLVAGGDRGGLLFILFGAPVAHEDDPVRAVGFALEFQEAAHSLPFIRDQRIGISLGRVYAGLLGSGQRCTYTVLGDEVNVSARLSQSAAPGQILVSRHVQQAAAGRYAFSALGTAVVKGKEEAVETFEPMVARPFSPAAEERLVGREAEKRAIAQLLSVVAAGQGRLLLMEGEAGVGKSALVREVLRQVRAQGWRSHVGTCLSYGQHIPYLPWRLILEDLYGLTPEMGPAERVARLEQAIAELPEPPERPDYWRARFPLLAEAMGLEVPDTPLTRSLEGELRRDNTFQTLEAMVRRLALSGPAVVVLEDAYWADELSLSLAAHIGRGLEGCPLLLVVVQRPFTRAEPAALAELQSVPNRITLSLTVLEPEPALELARHRLHTAVLSPPLEALLQERARGNPFFIEELLRALQEAGHLRRQDGTVELVGSWETLELPGTIEGLVQARLDRLPEEERLTLKVASVIGRTFPRPLLGEVHPDRPPEGVLSRQLADLGAAAFVQMEEGAPEWRYAFQHPILHEVTYGTLLFAQRRQLHGAIGSVLEAWHSTDLARMVDLLAYHYARSEEREKAVHYLQRAAEKARREYANEVALGYYSQALERLLAEEQELRYDLLAGRERIYNLLGERNAQREDLEEMGRLAEAWRDSRLVMVLNRQARLAVDMGEFQMAAQLAEQAWIQGEKSGDPAGQAEARKVLGVVHASQGRYEEAVRSFTQSWKIYRALGDLGGEITCLINLGTVHLYRGAAEQARQNYFHALELVSSEGNRWLEARLLTNLGLAESHLGAYERALEHYRQALAIFQEIGSAADEEVVLDNSGGLTTILGDLDSAEEYHRRALHLAQRLQDREGAATNRSCLGLLAAYRADWTQAHHFLAEALAQYQAMGHRRGEAAVRHNQGLVELWSGEAKAAGDSFRRALELRREIGETGNALLTQAWLGLACLLAGEKELAGAHLEEVQAQLAAVGYGGDSPEQEVWWTAYQVWLALGQEHRAGEALERAHRLVQEQAGRIHDPVLRRSFLERVPVNREIERAWGR